MHRGGAVVTPEQTIAVLDAIRTGLSITGAAEAAGIDRGEIVRRMHSEPDFAAAVRVSEEVALDGYEDVVARAAQTDWRAALAVLQARRPERWASARPETDEPTAAAAQETASAIIANATRH
jgi:ribosome-interacting GTPase 1